MGQTLQYKGYDGSVEYSAEVRCCTVASSGFGTWLFTVAASIRDIEKNFRGAVDEYLAFCKAEGKAADVPFKGSFNVRIPQELHQRAAQYADEHDLKLNAAVQLP